MCEINIINSDSLFEMKKFKDNEFDYGFTSPPYNRKRNDKYTLYEDKIDDYYQFLIDATEELLRICKNGVFINIQANYYNRVDVYKFIGYFSEKIQENFIHVKTNPMPANGKNITNAVEYYLYLSDERPKSLSTYTKNVIESSTTKMPKEHKAVMNTDICKWFISHFIKEGSKVIDPFAGYGTTLLVCNKLNINCTGIEIIPEYCEMIKERLTNAQ